MSLTGIILAAGSSTRMGRPKQLLPLGERCLLQHVVDEALRSQLDDVVIVLGARADEIRAVIALPATGRARIVVNPDHAAGQSTSLRAGLAAAGARARGVAVLLGDEPGVRAEVIDRVADVFEGGDAPIVRPIYVVDGRTVPGHPVILARSIWPELETLRGDRGARALWLAHPEWLRDMPIEGEPPPDVDTEAAYRRVVRDCSEG